MLSDSPVFVQPYQLPKLQADSVAMDKLGPMPEKWDNQDLDNRSVGSYSLAESAPSVMSSATAARTMLAEMGTLRNVRNMMYAETREAQAKVDNTTWRPGAIEKDVKGDKSGDDPLDIRLSTTFSAYGNALEAYDSNRTGAGGKEGESWISGFGRTYVPQDSQKVTSMGKFLEQVGNPRKSMRMVKRLTRTGAFQRTCKQG